MTVKELRGMAEAVDNHCLRCKGVMVVDHTIRCALASAVIAALEYEALVDVGPLGEHMAHAASVYK